ncbi:MAG TPA: YciI family protein [Candidatus Limnocylindria bacterium]|nr:YciI family protein [Candidatus Limnocylindria bacterium]
MKYMVLISGGETWDGLSEEQQADLYQNIGAWWAEQVQNGRILEGYQLQGAETATTVRRDLNGNVTVTDGPYIEAKETVGGYAVIDVPDLDAAISLVSGWPGPDALEIRPVVERDG